MCGFIGIFNPVKTLGNEDIHYLQLANSRLTKRGPDGEGYWQSPCGHIALAHKRLAIIDLSSLGAQPMQSVNGRYTIVFNGEIYNYAELRSNLEKLGYRFASHTDTEVIMNAYAEWGPNCLPQFRGMFAFAIWDSVKNNLFCARDAFGIKPLYLRQQDTTWMVGSQVRALAAIPGNLSKSAAAEIGFYLWGHVPEPHTPFAEIFSLAAGHYLLLEKANLQTSFKPPKPVCWLSITELINISLTQNSGQAKLNEIETQERLRFALIDTIAAHRVADVPVGVFLSSGLDSSTIAALACEADQKTVKTVTLGFSEYTNTLNDEVPLAEKLAAQIHSHQTSVRISATDFAVNFSKIIAAMDQPSIDGINTYFVSLVTQQTGLKVALSGLGADELLGGYPGFSQIPKLAALPNVFRRLGTPLRQAISPWIGNFLSPKTAGCLEYGSSFEHAYLLRRALYMPWELTDFVPQETITAGLTALNTLAELQNTHSLIQNPHLKITALETSWYMRNQLLRDSDWASMAHSLELRVPFVDIPFWQVVIPLLITSPPVTKKHMALTPQQALPDSILQRKKTGFTVPMREWLLKNTEYPQQEVGLRPWSKYVYQLWWDSFKS
jgi:asparagine synthase (glutamine-hydrolysing)